MLAPESTKTFAAFSGCCGGSDIENETIKQEYSYCRVFLDHYTLSSYEKDASK